MRPQPEPLRVAPPQDSPVLRAGKKLEPLLARMQVYNLSAVRVLDSQGCVVATTRGESGLCLDNLPEVESALVGRYASVIRERISDEPLPPFSDVRSRGSVRLFVALPLFSDGKVIAVVRASRTSLDARTSLWHNRRGLLFWLAATIGLGALFLFFQAEEYIHAYHELNLTLGSGIYGSTFFMLTGFHGMHVTLGAIMLTVIWLRCAKGHFSKDHHFAFEAVAWYWHFVDVVWLGLFLFVYVL